MHGAGVYPVADEYGIGVGSEQSCEESLAITKWRRHFRTYEMISDVRVSCVWLMVAYFNHYEH